LGFLTVIVLLEEVVASSQTPNLEDQDISLSLASRLRPASSVATGMGDPASSYATAGLALRILLNCTYITEIYLKHYLKI